MNTSKTDTKRVFLKKGACSHTLFYILNREFGFVNDIAETASDPLAGGLAQEGYQCGMLWGAALGVGAESYRRNKNVGIAATQVIIATQHMLKSFIERAKSANCSVITDCDFNSRFGLAKYLVSGKPIKCFRLADKWVPEAIKSAREGLTLELTGSQQGNINCASELVRKMGGCDEEIVMVAGFAGGFGLSGNACGALAATIWMKTLSKVRENNYKFTVSNPDIENIKEKFYEETDYKMECSKICGLQFDTIEEHSEFIKNGGCNRLIDALSHL